MLRENWISVFLKQFVSQSKEDSLVALGFKDRLCVIHFLSFVTFLQIGH